MPDIGNLYAYKEDYSDPELLYTVTTSLAEKLPCYDNTGTFANEKVGTVISPVAFNLLEKYNFTVAATPSTAAITITPHDKPDVTGFGTLTVRDFVNTEFDWSVTNSGYKSQSGVETLTADHVLSVSLRQLLPLVEVYSNYTAGNFTFTVPEQYNYISVEIAGAAGQQAYSQSSDSTVQWNGVVGQGAIKTAIFDVTTDRTVTGVIGAQPPKVFNQSQRGGSGYQSGTDGDMNTGSGMFAVAAGGGGGSSVLNYGSTSITVGGGSGCGIGLAGWFNCSGGQGGGPNGGARATGTPSSTGNWYNGNNATDSGVAGLNSGPGYVKIYAGYR